VVVNNTLLKISLAAAALLKWTSFRKLGSAGKRGK
jgi:hypothetical protein